MRQRVFDPVALAEILKPFSHASGCCIALSGGLDSMVLLHALVQIRTALPWPLRAIHINHGLQKAALAWPAFCRRQCELRDVELTDISLQLEPIAGVSVEAQAREARYEAFKKYLKPNELLLTAHHEDDQAETLLLALCRGSGIAGLAAMPFASSLGVGQLVRPLLSFSRNQLTEYAKSVGLEWVEDPTNTDSHFARNFLRQQVVPILQQRWPNITTTIARSARHCARSHQLISQLAADNLAAIGGSLPGTIAVHKLLRLDQALQAEVLRFWIRRHNLALPDERRLRSIQQQLLLARIDANPEVVWVGGQVRRYRDDLFALPVFAYPPTEPLTWLVKEKQHFALPNGLGCLYWQDDQHELPNLKIQVLFRHSGIRLRRHPQAVPITFKQWAQEQGIPAWLRSCLPLLYSGETLVAIPGLWQLEDYSEDNVLPRNAVVWQAPAWLAPLLDGLQRR